VWHASAAHHQAFAVGLSPLWLTSEAKLWAVAESALDGVGDPALGEWRERLPYSVHIKRRLTPEEWGARPWGTDYRKTEEGERRLAEIIARLPESHWSAVMAEIR